MPAGILTFYGYVLNNPINWVDPWGFFRASPFGDPIGYDTDYGGPGSWSPPPRGGIHQEGNITEGQKNALLKTGIGTGLIIGGSLTLPEGATFIAIGIPMLAEGLTLDLVEFGFHSDTSNIPSAWEVFGTTGAQIYELNNPCP